MTQKMRSKLAMLKRGTYITDLARRVGFTRQWTSKVMYGHATSPKSRQALAKALRMRVSDLWPDGKSGKA